MKLVSLLVLLIIFLLRLDLINASIISESKVNVINLPSGIVKIDQPYLIDQPSLVIGHNTIIECNGNRGVFNITASSNFTGITIQNCSNTVDPGIIFAGFNTNLEKITLYFEDIAFYNVTSIGSNNAGSSLFNINGSAEVFINNCKIYEYIPSVLNYFDFIFTISSNTSLSIDNLDSQISIDPSILNLIGCINLIYCLDNFINIKININNSRFLDIIPEIYLAEGSPNFNSLAIQNTLFSGSYGYGICFESHSLISLWDPFLLLQNVTFKDIFSPTCDVQSTSPCYYIFRIGWDFPSLNNYDDSINSLSSNVVIEDSSFINNNVPCFMIASSFTIINCKFINNHINYTNWGNNPNNQILPLIYYYQADTLMTYNYVLIEGNQFDNNTINVYDSNLFYITNDILGNSIILTYVNRNYGAIAPVNLSMKYNSFTDNLILYHSTKGVPANFIRIIGIDSIELVQNTIQNNNFIFFPNFNFDDMENVNSVFISGLITNIDLSDQINYNIKLDSNIISGNGDYSTNIYNNNPYSDILGVISLINDVEIYGTKLNLLIQNNSVSYNIITTFEFSSNSDWMEVRYKYIKVDQSDINGFITMMLNILEDNNSNITIVGNRFDSNYLKTGDNLLGEVQVSGNVYGGIISLNYISSKIIISDNLFTNNTVISGSGGVKAGDIHGSMIYLSNVINSDNATVILSDNHFINNKVGVGLSIGVTGSLYGGLIDCHFSVQSDIIVTNINIQNNFVGPSDYLTNQNSGLINLAQEWEGFLIRIKFNHTEPDNTTCLVSNIIFQNNIIIPTITSGSNGIFIYIIDLSTMGIDNIYISNVTLLSNIIEYNLSRYGFSGTNILYDSYLDSYISVVPQIYVSLMIEYINIFNNELIINGLYNNKVFLGLFPCISDSAYQTTYRNIIVNSNRYLVVWSDDNYKLEQQVYFQEKVIYSYSTLLYLENIQVTNNQFYCGMDQISQTNTNGYLYCINLSYFSFMPIEDANIAIININGLIISNNTIVNNVNSYIMKTPNILTGAIFQFNTIILNNIIISNNNITLADQNTYIHNQLNNIILAKCSRLNLTVTNFILDHNQLGSGGIITLYQSTGIVTTDNITITNNDLRGGGGFMYLDIDNSTVVPLNQSCPYMDNISSYNDTNKVAWGEVCASSPVQLCILTKDNDTVCPNQQNNMYLQPKIPTDLVLVMIDVYGQIVPSPFNGKYLLGNVDKNDYWFSYVPQDDVKSDLDGIFLFQGVQTTSEPGTTLNISFQSQVFDQLVLSVNFKVNNCSPGYELTYSDNEVSCILCQDFQYSLNAESCKSCPYVYGQYQSCFNLTDSFILHGFSITGDLCNPGIIMECPNQDACRKFELIRCEDNQLHVTDCSTDVNSDQLYQASCEYEEGYTGRLCSRCHCDHSDECFIAKTVINPIECVECSEHDGHVVEFILIGIVAILSIIILLVFWDSAWIISFIELLVILVLYLSQINESWLLELAVIMFFLSVISKGGTATGEVKILLYFGQTVEALYLNFMLNDQIERIIESVNFVNFRATSIQCLFPTQLAKLEVQIFFPLFTPFILSLVLYLLLKLRELFIKLVNYIRTSPKMWHRLRLPKQVKPINNQLSPWGLSLFLLYASYFDLSNLIFLIIGSYDHEYYLEGISWLSINNPIYDPVWYISITLIPLFVIGLPLFFGVVLIYYRKQFVALIKEHHHHEDHSNNHLNEVHFEYDPIEFSDHPMDSINGYSNNLCQDSPSFCMANPDISCWNSSKEITHKPVDPVNKRLINHYGFLFESYTADKYWFELVWIFRRLLLGIILGLVPNNDPWQDNLILMVLLTSLLIILVLKPFNYWTENWSAIITDSTLLLSYAMVNDWDTEMLTFSWEDEMFTVFIITINSIAFVAVMILMIWRPIKSLYHHPYLHKLISWYNRWKVHRIMNSYSASSIDRPETTSLYEEDE